MPATMHFFDNASTTPCTPEVSERMSGFSCEYFGNPSSAHSVGRQASKAIREARLWFAETFNVEPEQIIFTGGGTEADNLAILGTAFARLARTGNHFKVLASAIEHPAVSQPVKSLREFGIQAEFIPVDSCGQIQESAFLQSLSENTALVSVLRVNNIIGSILPVETLAKKAKERFPEIVFHSDCIQAFCKTSVPRAGSSVDLVSLSAHKIGGPKGIGALVVLNPALLQSKKLRPIVFGGGQECGYRGGTQNAGLIAGFHTAAKQSLQKQERFIEHTRELKARLCERLQVSLSHLIQINSPDDALPSIVSLSLKNIPSAPLTKLLEEKGMVVSTGSACSSSKPGPDPVLSAIGLKPELAESSLRISFSLSNTEEEVDLLVSSLSQSIDTIKELLGR